jgi:small neutral amino acid transporter SnatA (MarC family)
LDEEDNQPGKTWCFCLQFDFSPGCFFFSGHGPKGQLISSRLSAFLVFCVGLQILIDGLTALIK